jgi:cytochrome c peroxidase
MRFKPESSDGANAGLEHARAFLEPIKQKHPWITYADLWTLAGAVSIQGMSHVEILRRQYAIVNTATSTRAKLTTAMDGPAIPWRDGRSDKDPRKVAVRDIPPNGRLPDASQGSSHLRDVPQLNKGTTNLTQIFYRMGFNDQEIVCLSGAHSLGRCHTSRSGYTGPWTHTPTRFSNQYYKLLLKLKWSKKEWKGPEQFVDPEGELMMLPSDLALVHVHLFDIG